MTRVPDPANRRGPGFVPGLVRAPEPGVQMREGAAMGEDRIREPKKIHIARLGGLPKLQRYGV